MGAQPLLKALVARESLDNSCPRVYTHVVNFPWNLNKLLLLTTFPCTPQSTWDFPT